MATPYSIVRSGTAPAETETATVDTTGSSTNDSMATTMILNGAAGCLVGAAGAPRGQEGVWGAIGFVMGSTLGEFGIVGVALAALWKKVG